MGRALKCDRCGKYYDVTPCNDMVGVVIDYGPREAIEGWIFVMIVIASLLSGLIFLI